MDAATANAPLFIEAFYDGCEASRNQNLAVPDMDVMNDVLASHGVPFRIEPPDLTPMGGDNAAVVIPVPERPPTLAEQAVVVLQRSLARSEKLLEQGRDREAVQEILFLLESVATAFRGLDTEAGQIGGGYFNQIVRELPPSGRTPSPRENTQLAHHYVRVPFRHPLVAASDMGSTSTEASRSPTVRHASTAT